MCFEHTVLLNPTCETAPLSVVRNALTKFLNGGPKTFKEGPLGAQLEVPVWRLLGVSLRSQVLGQTQDTSYIFPVTQSEANNKIYIL